MESTKVAHSLAFLQGSLRQWAIASLLLLMSWMGTMRVWSQVPTCGSNVPYDLVDLRGNPDSLYISDPIVRTGQCCGVTNPVRCISFEVLLDPNAAGVVMFSSEGALPPGSYFYQIGCGPHLYLDSVICLTGPGPHYITFCKPGGNVNVYGIKSVGKPTFPQDDSTRIGCYKRLTTYGLDTSTVVWNSIYPGAPGAYNSYLSATSNATSVIFTPGAGSPPYIDYQTCGQPAADECGYILYTCDTVRMYVQPALEVTVGPQPANYCASSGGLTLTATPSGGDTHYTYQWRNPLGTIISTADTAYANMPGNYIVYVNDGLSGPTCAGVNYTIQVNVTPDPIVSAGPDQLLCPVSPTATLAGTITNAPGGTWSGGAGTFNPNASNLHASYAPTAVEIGAGSVTLTLTSVSGGACPDISDMVTLSFGDTLVAGITTGTPACHGDSVTLTANVTAGNGGYTYLWSTTATTNSIQGADGAYCVTVTDLLGCEDIVCSAVASPPILNVSTTATDATTIGGTDGTATATASGGAGGYSYSWSNGGNTAAISGLGLGIYTVTVTDANGCTATASAVVNDPRCLGFTATALGDVADCNGAKDAFVHVSSVSGGMPPYSYLWLTTPPQANDTAFNLGAGAYSVVVTDNQGCNHLVSVTVTEPPRLENFMTHTNNTIIGGTAGTATANPVGGNGGYNYVWSDGQTTQVATGLAAGTYHLTITDMLGCLMVDSVRITEPPCNDFNLSFSHNDVSCYGGNDGSATVIATGATAPLAYNWNTGATTATISSLTNGNYSVTVTDAVNCQNFASLAITMPTQLAITFIPTNVRCNGGHDGSIDLTVTGGTPPYSFAWSNLSTSEDLILLLPGAYSVTVTDANGCTISGSRNITEPAKIGILPLISPVTCAGMTDGDIDLTVGGGVGSFTYAWSTGASTQDLLNLPSGAYMVTVTDANLCPSSKAFYVPQPDTLHIDSFDIACPDPLTGNAEITAYISGGNGRPWSLSTNNGTTFGSAGDTTATVAAGATYNLVAQDPAGCLSPMVPATVNSVVQFQSISFNLCHALGATQTLVTVTGNGGAGNPYSLSFDGGTSFGTPGNLDSLVNVGTTYTLTLRDNLLCLSADTTISIPSEMTANATSPTHNCGYNISCNGLNDGQATVSAIGGQVPYTYAWSNGQTSATATSLVAGTYNVTVTDANGCTASTSVTLTQPAVVTASASSPTFNCGTNVSCNGASDGSATVTPGGGCAPYTYLWSNGQTTATATTLAAGTYNVTVTDANGCTASTSVTLTQPAIVTASASSPTFNCGTNVSCNGSTDGSATVTPGGGCAPYSYLWSNGQTTATATTLAAGTYNVTVTDANGCTASTSVTLTQPAVVTASASSPTFNCGTNVSCNGATDGSATVTPGGGCAPYTYLWSNGQTTATATTLAAGTYNVTVTDANGCTAATSVTLSQPAVVTASANSPTFNCGTNVSCNGSTDGSATVTPGGGCAPYTYLWSNGQTTATGSTLAAGTYNVTVTDANGCTASTSVTLTQPTIVTASASSPTFNCGTNVSCNGSTDGSATVTPGGGCAPYTYLWSNGQTTATATTLAAGTYNVTVTDANGCTASSNVTLTQPAVVTASASSPTFNCGTNVSCNGSTDGSATVTPGGGCAPYTYLWSNGQTTATATSLAAGTYNVTVTDANGCTAATSVTLTQPAIVTASASSPTFNCGTNVSCNGATDGSATVTPGGGCAPYTYLWSNGQTTATATTLAAGTYNVTVTDANGCTAATSVTLTQPAIVTASASSPTFNCGTNVSCNSATDGSATVTPGGGCAPYTYLWSNGQTTATASTLAAGTYNVTVTDANGCTAATSVTLTQPAVVTASASSPTFNCGANVSCNGSSDGSATVTPGGGCAPYTFLWSNGQTSATATTLAAGTYSVTVTDANGCTASTSVTLTQPAIVTASASSPTFNCGTNVSCNGATDGSATVTPGGGCAPYGYLWSNGQTTATATSLAAGTYTVTVTDANGCTASTSVTLTQPAVVTASASSPTFNCGTNVSCNGSTDGSATVTPGGGCAPYTYLWSNGQTTATATSLAAGTYTVTVTDANGCTASTSVTLTQPAVVTASASSPTFNCGTNVSCNGSTDGSATVTPGGGCAPYTYLWSNGQTTATATTLASGTYNVTVTDANGCTAATSVTLTQPTVVTASASSPTFNCGTNVSCNGASDGSATVTPGGGCSPYTYLWSNGQTTATATTLAAGTYNVTVTDANGCTASTNVTLTQPAIVTASASSPTFNCGTNVSCNGSTDGSATVTPGGGCAPYTYLWSNGQTTATATTLAAGTYNVTVTDANGCTAATSVTLTQPAIVTASASSPTFNCGTNVSCNGSTDGSATVTPGGGCAPYTYLWSNGQTTATATTLAAGTYNVSVTDANGCTAATSVTLTQPAILTASASSPTYNCGTNVSCNGSTDGSAIVTPGGGCAPYTYLWSNGQTTATATTLAAGTYNVTVTDANGCTASTTVTLTQPAIVTASASSPTFNCGTNVSCNGAADGSATVTPGGGCAPYTYLWSNGQTTATATTLAAGTYNVTVTDANGCTASTSVTLTQPAIVTASASSPTFNCGTNVSCNGATDGSATVTPGGGCAPYTYLWSNGQTTATATSLAAGTYNVTVTDANGCTASSSVTLTQPAIVTASASSPTFNCGTNVSCNGSTDGSATVTPGGGCAPYTYLWSNGQTTATATSLAAGTYNVTATDANGCTASTSITLTEPIPLAITTALLTYNCGYNTSTANSSDGEATANPSGGCAPYSYNWSNGQTTATATGLAAGSYTVTVTDANGCSNSSSVTLTAPQPFTVSVSSPTDNCGYNISCNGGANGSAIAVATGGCQPYTYLWNNFQSVDSIGGLTAGLYIVTVVDANSDSTSATILLTEPNPIVIADTLSQFAGGMNISCNGANDGWIHAGATGGANCAPYSFAWTGPNGFTSTQNAINGLAGGNYSVTVTDVNGCSATQTYTLTEPATITDLLTSPTFNGGWNLSCANSADGSIFLQANGGTVPYTYAWSNGSTSDTLTGLNAGTYWVTITDQNGCALVDSITLTEPTVISIAVTSPTFNGGWNIRCNGGTSGSVDLTVNGGSPGYNYAWSNGATTEDLLLVGAGTYTVTVTDANGCSSTASITLTEPAALSSTATASNYNGWNVTCNGSTDGAIDLTVNGGTAPYGYLWSNFSTNEDPNNLGAGFYIVAVTDANGCLLSDSISINEPPALALNANVTDVTCNGQASGAIDLTVGGGTPGYTYSWTNGSTTQDLSGLAAGSFAVTVTDLNGCNAQGNWTVVEASALVITGNAVPVSCNGQGDGSIDLSVAGGASPYTFIWNNGSTAEDLSGLAPGNYDVLVIDATGCSDSAAFAITEPAPLIAQAGADSITCASGLQLYAAALDSNQSGNWTLVSGNATLANPASPNCLVTDLSVGANAFVWTIIQGGCSASDTVIIFQPTPTECEPWPLEMPTGYTPNGDGANDYFVVHGIERYPNNLFQVFNRWGDKVYELRNYQNQWNGQNMNGGSLPDATYFVILDINNGEIVLHGYVDMRR